MLPADGHFSPPFAQEGSAPPIRQLNVQSTLFFDNGVAPTRKHTLSAERANEIASSYFSPLWAAGSKIAYFFPKVLFQPGESSMMYF